MVNPMTAGRGPWSRVWRWRRRVPVVLQMNSVECGAASLAMILSYYGRDTDVHECREACSVGRDGVSASTIAQTARGFGLEVKAFTIGTLEDLRTVPCPAILHWSFSHFVVLEDMVDDGALIVDPSAGRRHIPLSELDKLFTGVVLTFQPTDNFDRSRRRRRGAWRTYLSHLPLNRTVVRMLGEVLAGSALLQSFALVFPLFTKVLIDRILPLHMQSALPAIGFAVLCIVIAQSMARWLRGVLLVRLQAMLDGLLMRRFCEHLLRLPLSFFQEHTTGDLMMRVGANTQVRDALTGQVLALLLDGVFLVACIVGLLIWSPMFALAVFGLGALQLLILIGLARPTRRVTDEYVSAQAAASSQLVQTLTGVASLRAAGAESLALAQWNTLLERQLDVSVRRNSLAIYAEAALSGARMLPQLALLWVGAWYVLSGETSLGTILGLISLASLMLSPISSLAGTIQQWQLVTGYLQRIHDVMVSPPEQAGRPGRTAPRLTGRIEVRGLSFRYHDHAPHVLRDISFTVAPGQRVAIVGRTGSGKSTLIRLMLGLYEPTGGQILYDGESLSDLDYGSVRRQVGTVMQDVVLFGDTVRQNISFGRPDASLATIRAAARRAVVDHEVQAMPLQYDTLISEGGSALSGGQRQRLAVARALVGQPSILYLDEATSQLDELTERTLHANLAGLACTRLVISHRLSIARDADLVLVLDKGHLVEAGTHDTLVSMGGLYARFLDRDTVDVRVAVGS
jgi:ABC-type bacteriocin/lantibiotic exporter with double-glycine peptidase domain